MEVDEGQARNGRFVSSDEVCALEDVGVKGFAVTFPVSFNVHETFRCAFPIKYVVA